MATWSFGECFSGRRSELKKILADNCVSFKFLQFISDLSIERAKNRGWAELKIGVLLEEAERAGFNVLLTTDKQMRFQQNMEGRQIALVVVAPLFVRFDSLAPLESQVRAAILDAKPGTITVVKSME